MTDPPAALRVEALTKEKSKLEADLKAARESGTAAPAATDDGGGSQSNEKIEQLTKENTDLKGKLSAEMLKVNELNGKVTDLEGRLATATSGERDVKLVELEDDNMDLKRELERLTQDNSALKTKLSATSGIQRPEIVVNGLSSIMLGAIGIGFLLSFVAGIWLMDWRQRQRHGGFRI